MDADKIIGWGEGFFSAYLKISYSFYWTHDKLNFIQFIGAAGNLSLHKISPINISPLAVRVCTSKCTEHTVPIQFHIHFNQLDLIILPEQSRQATHRKCWFNFPLFAEHKNKSVQSSNTFIWKWCETLWPRLANFADGIVRSISIVVVFLRLFFCCVMFAYLKRSYKKQHNVSSLICVCLGNNPIEKGNIRTPSVRLNRATRLGGKTEV